MIPDSVHRMPFGACFDGERTRFRIWAPDADRIAVQLLGGDRDDHDRRTALHPMHDEGDGWFIAHLPCPPGTRYNFVLHDGTCVPDPASRYQPEGVEGPSEVVDPLRYRWRNNDWRGRPWHETVLYELHVGACGGFAGVRGKLAGLARIGVTAIELMPVGQFPGRRNWGYDGVLPFAPAECYGSPDDLKALVDCAHGLGLMVFLDVVYNHFGPQGNHLPRYASAFFRDDLDTPWGSALDFREPVVREFFIHNALYWLREFRFDGLRLDAVHEICGRDWLLELAQRIDDECAVPPRHLMVENDDNDAGLLGDGRFTAQWNDDAHHALHVALTGESAAYYGDYADAPEAALARWLADGFVFQGEPSGHRGGQTRGTRSRHLPPSVFVNYLQNHDQIGNRALGERISTLARPGALRAATALLLLTPQIPMLFMGEDWNNERPFLYFTDFHGALAEAVREGRREEFSGFPAFADPDRRQSIPDPNDVETFRRSVPDFEAAEHGPGLEHRQWVAGLLALRREHVVPRIPGARAGDAQVLGRGAVRADWRIADGSQLRLHVQLGPEPIAVEPAPPGRLLFESRDGDAAALADGCLPGETLVLMLHDAAP